VLSRIFEAAGTSTVAISLVREHTVAVKPPRAVFVPFPLGLPLGHPGAAGEQRAVLDLAFSTLAAPAGPVLVEYPDTASDEHGSPYQASDVTLDDRARELDLATEVARLLPAWEAHRAATGRTAIGLCGVPPQRFRDVVRFLEAYLCDTGSDSPDRPGGVDLPTYVRWCVEDVRVFYIEARLQSHPSETSDERALWLLGGTALGAFLRELKAAMESSDDPKTKAAAFGIAR
jgi:hypothetical protein